MGHRAPGRARDEHHGTRAVREPPRFRDPDVIDSVVKAAVEHELWDELWPLVPGLPATSQERIAETVQGLEPGLRARLAEHARSIGAYDALGPVGAALEA